MKKIFLKFIICVLFSVWIGQASAVEPIIHTGKVSKIMVLPKTYQSYSTTTESLTMIFVEGLPKSCNQENGMARVAIGTNHSAHNTALALALSAHASGKTVKIAYLNSCTLRSNAWDFSYLYINE